MKQLFLIGGTDSIGVPYTRDNKNNIGFFELIKEELSKSYKVIDFNFFHMATNNRSEFIIKCLEKNSSLAEIKESQNIALRKCKYSGIYPFSKLPKSFLNFYKINKEDCNIKVKDELVNNNTMFIYSSGVNDFLKSNNISLFKLLFPNTAKKNTKDNDNIIDECINNIRSNIQYILKLNKNTEIYLIGLFYPTNLNYIRKILKESIDDFNRKLQKLCNEFENVYYINNNNLDKNDFLILDFHPNKKGHTKIYQNFLKVYKKTNI